MNVLMLFSRINSGQVCWLAVRVGKCILCQFIFRFNLSCKPKLVSNLINAKSELTPKFGFKTERFL